jgi:putative ABC transport system permease protein
LIVTLLNLLRLFSLRYVARHRLRTALGFSAIALAVALYVSSAMANAGIVASAERTARDLAGSADWIVARCRTGPIDDGILRRVRGIPGAVAAPLIQAPTTIPGESPEPILIFGVDFMSDAMLRLYEVSGASDPAAVVRTAFRGDGILVSRRLAARRDLAVGSRLPVNAKDGPRDLEVTGLLEDVGPARVFGGGFAVVRIGTAQRLFRSPGVYDRIEIAGPTRGQVEEALPECAVEPAGRIRSVVIDAINRLESFVAIGVIALLVGIFIVYNAVAISVVERSKLIGTLRALGTTSRQIQTLLFAEWLAIGLLGSVAGVIVGIALARGLVRFAADTINSLMLVIDVQEIPVDPTIAATGLALGIVASLVAAWFPARQAMRTSPVEILRPRSYRLRRRKPRMFQTGLATFGLWIAVTLAFGPHSLMALVSTGLVFVAIALMLPSITMRAARGLRASAGRLFGAAGFLGLDNVTKFPDRTALTATALAGTLAMMVASATLVAGFASGTRNWMDQAFPFDVAVTASDFMTSVYTSDVLPRSTIDDVRAVEGAGIVYGVQKAFAEFEKQEVMVLALEAEGFWSAHAAKGLSEWARQFGDPAANEAFLRGEAVHVSRNFSQRFGVGEGDRILLPTPSGAAGFEVTHVIEDYSWPQGLVAIDLDRFRELWKDDALTYIDVRAAPGVEPAELKRRLEEALDDRTAFVYTVDEIKDVATDTLHQTMVFANVQVLIAIAIGFLGIVNTLLMSVMQRTREIGLLRAVGMTRRQVARTVTAEAVYTALLGGVIGILTGILGALIPVRLYMLSVTGYLMPIAIPWLTLLGALVAALAIGWIASVLPARRAARIDVLEAIGYE